MKPVSSLVQFDKPRPDAAVRLFCLPYAGAGASVYRSWSARMPVDIELYAVQLPGRETRLREPPFRRVDELVDHLLPGFLPYLDRPFAVFGHSMGALLGYELIRAITRETGLRPTHFFASGRDAPHLPSGRGPIYRLSDLDLLDYVNSLNGTPEAVFEEPELVSLILPLIRADFELTDTYRFVQDGVELECPVTVFGGNCDPTVTKERLEAWSTLAGGDFRVRLFDGDHFFLIEQMAEVTHCVSSELLRSLSP